MADGHVLVNGRRVKQNHRATADDRVTVILPDPVPTSIRPEDIPLDVLFEDGHLLVVNKPAGMSVHPAGPRRTGTLVNALLAHCRQLSGVNGRLRPGIVHRLDMDTTGLLVVAKDDRAHAGIAKQFEARTVARRYEAVVWGCPRPAEGRVEAPIGRHRADRKRMAVQRGGRYAATRYVVRTTYEYLSLLRVRLETGRTHQIRVHMSHVGHPVLGDAVYAGREKRLAGISPAYRPGARRLLGIAKRQMLHACTLGFVHPISGDRLRFSSQPPEDMQAVLTELREGVVGVSGSA